MMKLRASQLRQDCLSSMIQASKTTTLRETNIAPENQWLEDEISFGDTLSTRAMLVLGRVQSVPKKQLYIGAHNSTYRGEQKPQSDQIRPFIGVKSYNFIYD